MAAEEWYYAMPGDTSPRGPLPLETLQAWILNGELTPQARVWTEGMADWEIAATRLQPAAAVPVQQLAYQSRFAFVPRYAGFWLRVWAAIIDYIITWASLKLVNYALGVLVDMTIVRGASGHSQWMVQNLPSSFSGLIVSWLYTSLLESGPKQATLGKIAMRLVVVDETGARVSFGRATGRHFAKYLSMFIIGIGYLMAGWTQQKQALHDLVAQTLVIRKSSR